MSNNRANLYLEPDGSYRAMCGSSIEPTIKEAIELASTKDSISFDFNGVSVTVKKDSDSSLILRDWDRSLHGYIEKKVGHYPPNELTPEEIESDSKIAAANQAESDERTRIWKLKEDEKRAATEARLALCPPIEFSDKELWEKGLANNADSYGRGIYDFAERWARLMQFDMTASEDFPEVAERTSREADIDGLTGFMYSAAVSVLSSTWVHGEMLRKWHNKSYGVAESEEGVVNPAILTIGKK